MENLHRIVILDFTLLDFNIKNIHFYNYENNRKDTIRKVYSSHPLSQHAIEDAANMFLSKQDG